MRHSVFITIRLVILTSIFLIPFTIIAENMLIRLIAGSLLGLLLIIFLSFVTKIQSVLEKEKKY